MDTLARTKKPRMPILEYNPINGLRIAIIALTLIMLILDCVHISQLKRSWSVLGRVPWPFSEMMGTSDIHGPPPAATDLHGYYCLLLIPDLMAFFTMLWLLVGPKCKDTQFHIGLRVLSSLLLLIILLWVPCEDIVRVRGYTQRTFGSGTGSTTRNVNGVTNLNNGSTGYRGNIGVSGDGAGSGAGAGGGWIKRRFNTVPSLGRSHVDFTHGSTRGEGTVGGTSRVVFTRGSSEQPGIKVKAASGVIVDMTPGGVSRVVVAAAGRAKSVNSGRRGAIALEESIEMVPFQGNGPTPTSINGVSSSSVGITTSKRDSVAMPAGYSSATLTRASSTTPSGSLSAVSTASTGETIGRSGSGNIDGYVSGPPSSGSVYFCFINHPEVAPLSPYVYCGVYKTRNVFAFVLFVMVLGEVTLALMRDNRELED
ncbi:hypothetical protein BGZ98_000043 [Dissophora globulifera]|nr:hypothetical protein BGZ98_000043 [Dissophora globulifera]